MLKHCLSGCAGILLIGLGTFSLGTQTQPEKKAFRIGVSDALQVVLQQSTSAATLTSLQPLAEVFATVAGIHPQLQLASPDKLAELLQSGQIDLAVMPGIEYGWLREKTQGLEPFLVIINNDMRLRACLLIRVDGLDRGGVAALKGKKLAFPKRSEFH